MTSDRWLFFSATLFRATPKKDTHTRSYELCTALTGQSAVSAPRMPSALQLGVHPTLSKGIFTRTLSKKLTVDFGERCIRAARILPDFYSRIACLGPQDFTQNSVNKTNKLFSPKVIIIFLHLDACLNPWLGFRCDLLLSTAQYDNLGW